MPTTRKPRGGTLQYWPRKRARRVYPRFDSAPASDTTLPAFMGYKVGMTHVQIVDNNPKSLTKNETITWPVTILEFPPLKPFALRFYQKSNNALKLITEIHSKNLNKELGRKIDLQKKPSEKQAPAQFDKLTIMVYTQPKLTTIGKKKPEIIEIPIKDNNIEEGKKLLEQKEISIKEFFQNGNLIDVHSVSKGKGLNGPIKRYGLVLKQHKSEKKKRSSGNLGAWKPKKVLFSVPQPGQMGMHTRTEYNKQIVLVSDDPKVINSKEGFKRYGLVKNTFVLVKGSIAGAQKRAVIISKPIRALYKPYPFELKYIKK